MPLASVATIPPWYLSGFLKYRDTPLQQNRLPQRQAVLFFSGQQRNRIIFDHPHPSSIIHHPSASVVCFGLRSPVFHPLYSRPRSSFTGHPSSVIPHPSSVASVFVPFTSVPFTPVFLLLRHQFFLQFHCLSQMFTDIR